MRLRNVLVPLVLAAVAVVGIQGPASSAPLTKQDFTLTAPITEEGRHRRRHRSDQRHW